MPHPLDTLRRHAHDAAGLAHVPYSNQPAGAAVLLSDGQWVPGVRVESASFSLVLPALVNAFSTAVAADRRDIVAVALDHDAWPWEQAVLTSTPAGAFHAAASDAYVADTRQALPQPTYRLMPFLEAPAPDTPAGGIALARQVAERAYVPASAFPVGCVLVTEEARLIPGVNVEHEDWARTLCAERNALGTAISYGAGATRALYLTCQRDPACTPCGACRQLLAELAPEARLFMDRGSQTPVRTRPTDLLPGFFTGDALHPNV